MAVRNLSPSSMGRGGKWSKAAVPGSRDVIMLSRDVMMSSRDVIMSSRDVIMLRARIAHSGIRLRFPQCGEWAGTHDHMQEHLWPGARALMITCRGTHR